MHFNRQPSIFHSMDCLEKVNRREADFLAVDPEDMYVAFHMDNEDFSVFSEIRTAEEPEGIVHYFATIYVKHWP